MQEKKNCWSNEYVANNNLEFHLRGNTLLKSKSMSVNTLYTNYEIMS